MTLTKSRALLKQSLRDGLAMKNRGKMGKPRVLRQTTSGTIPPLIQHLVMVLHHPRNLDLHTLGGRKKNDSIPSPLELANSATASADFLVFFLQFFRCSNVSVGTNVGRTVKSSTNAKSTVGKFLKWFDAPRGFHIFSRFFNLSR